MAKLSAAMTRLNMFNSVSLDGYFTDSSNDMSWAHAGGGDKEFQDFVAGNAQGKSALIFGRVTYEMMAAFWPTPMAAQMMPEVAAGSVDLATAAQCLHWWVGAAS